MEAMHFLKWAAGAVVVITASAGCTINLGSSGNSAEPTPSSSPAEARTPSTQQTPPPTLAPSTASPTPTRPPSWASVTKSIRTGVVRLQIAGCEESWSGSGFLLSDGYIVTAAHVARDAVSISVKSDRGIVRAEVVDGQLSDDTALLRLRQDLEGHEFAVTSTAPTLGTEIGVLGYPFGVYNMTLTRGTISGETTSVTYDGEKGFTVDRVVTTDAAINGGNSGGPVIDESGRIVGLVSGARNWGGDPTKPVPAQGTNYLVPADVIHDRVAQWKRHTPTVTTCGDEQPAPVDADFDLDVAIDSDDDAADDIALSLYVHGDSINQGLYEAAWALFTPNLQSHFKDDVAGWSARLASSYWDQLRVDNVTRDGNEATAEVAFRTRQDPEDSYNGSQDCSDWTMTYSMILSRGVWFIDEAVGGHPIAC